MDHKRLIEDLVRSAEVYESKVKTVEVFDGYCDAHYRDDDNDQDRYKRISRVLEMNEIEGEI